MSLLACSALCDYFPQPLDQRGDVAALFYVVRGAGLEQANRLIDVAGSGHENDRGRSEVGQRLPIDLFAVSVSNRASLMTASKRNERRIMLAWARFLAA